MRSYQTKTMTLVQICHKEPRLQLRLFALIIDLLWQHTSAESSENVKALLCQSKPWLHWQELLGQVALIVVSWSWPQLSIVVVYPSQLCSFTISCGVHVLDLWSWDIASLKIFQFSASLFQGELGASAISVLRLCFSRRCIQCLVAAGARLSQCLPGPQKTRNPK